MDRAGIAAIEPLDAVEHDGDDAEENADNEHDIKGLARFSVRFEDDFV